MGFVTTSPTLICTEATAAEKRARDVLAHEAWGDRLSVAEFVEREARLRATPFATRAMRTWLLVEAGDLERRALASLETYEVGCALDGRAGRAFEIASVFTERALRGRGHATALVDAMARALAAPDALALTLYSDVGAAIYERAGFGARPAHDWTLAARRGEAPGVERLSGDAAVAAVLASRPVAGAFAIAPTVDQIGWHRAREEAYAALLGAPGAGHGVLRCRGGDALLAGDLKAGHLRVLGWWADDAAAARALAAAAADDAARAGLTDVVAWVARDDEGALAAGLAEAGAVRTPREGSLPMLRPLPAAPTLRAEAWADVPRALWM